MANTAILRYKVEPAIRAGIWATGSTLLFDRIRCDVTAYVNNSQGCVWSNMPGYFRLSLTGEAADSARWIAEAQQKLVTHPGLLGRGYGLHRADDIESAANRAASNRVCEPLRGSEPGKDCDEYPFAGRGRGRGRALPAQGVAWDVDMVVSGHNQMAGSLLGVFYSQERMWWGDHFYVVITP